MIVSDKPSRYRSYLLRCWEERGSQPGLAVQDQPADHTRLWRFSLEDPRTGQRKGFATLEALMLFLQTEIVDQ